MKAIQESRFGCGFAQLHETRMAQATVAPKELSLAANNRTASNGREFVLSIWFVEGLVRQIQAAQAIEAMEKLALIGDAENDHMRMRRI